MITPALILFLTMILIAAVLLVVLIVKTSGKHRRVKSLSVLGFMMIVAGIVLAGDPFLGYGLMTIGILITIVSILKVNKLRSRVPGPLSQ